jgi:NAD(P)-dependent dehydrogenase (short-subunit alcohol dehydrogenase family)
MTESTRELANSPDCRLDGKVALVAGGGAVDDGIGNGRAAAITFARAGARVCVADRDLDRAARTVAMIEADGGEATAFAADLTQEAHARDLIDAVIARYGRLDALDNNIGIGSRRSVVDESLAGWQKIMQVNVATMFLTSKYAIPAMIKTAGGGAIVNISSIFAMRPRGLTAYSTSKGAVIALTKAMAVDHGKDGIRVNCVAPGPVYTPMVADGMSAAARAQRVKASLLQREGTGWDIGRAVVFQGSSAQVTRSRTRSRTLKCWDRNGAASRSTPPAIPCVWPRCATKKQRHSDPTRRAAA